MQKEAFEIGYYWDSFLPSLGRLQMLGDSTVHPVL